MRISATLNNGLQIPQPAYLLSLPLQSNFSDRHAESCGDIVFVSPFNVFRRLDKFDHLIVYMVFRGTRLCKKELERKKEQSNLRLFDCLFRAFE
jgi:hypothetical protein